MEAVEHGRVAVEGGQVAYRVYGSGSRALVCLHGGPGCPSWYLDSLADLASSVGTKLVRDEEHRHVVAALQRLPVDQQMLLELHYWEDQDISSLAEVFDVPPATIRTRLHRARKALSTSAFAINASVVADAVIGKSMDPPPASAAESVRCTVSYAVGVS